MKKQELSLKQTQMLTAYLASKQPEMPRLECAMVLMSIRDRAPDKVAPGVKAPRNSVTQ